MRSIKCLLTFVLVLAACGIPFQVLPDYIEGAEQVSTGQQHFV